jgi:hypothetical protein
MAKTAKVRTNVHYVNNKEFLARNTKLENFTKGRNLKDLTSRKLNRKYPKHKEYQSQKCKT